MRKNAVLDGELVALDKHGVTSRAGAAQGQDRQAPGSGDRRIHRAAPDSAAVRRSGVSRARGPGLALCRPCRHWLLACDARGTLREDGAVASDQSPFKQRVKDEALTTWVKPKLVAEEKFTEWTSGGEMRHPAFLGLREGKKPMDVVFEKELHRST